MKLDDVGGFGFYCNHCHYNGGRAAQAAQRLNQRARANRCPVVSDTDYNFGHFGHFGQLEFCHSFSFGFSPRLRDCRCRCRCECPKRPNRPARLTHWCRFDSAQRDSPRSATVGCLADSNVNTTTGSASATASVASAASRRQQGRMPTKISVSTFADWLRLRRQNMRECGEARTISHIFLTVRKAVKRH